MAVSRKRTRPDVAVVGRKADVVVGHAGFYDITAVLIDMTGWNNGEHGDADLYDEGIRPYRVDFLDGRKRNQTVYGTRMNSGCLQDVLVAAKSEFRAVVSPSTEIMIICPADCLDESSRRESGQARLCKFKASDLFTMGPEEKDLFLSDGGAARARLDTCLDSLAHAVLVDRQPCYPPMERRRRFPRSVHDFSEEDRGLYFQWADEYARYQKEIQEEYARRHSGRYYEEGGG